MDELMDMHAEPAAPGDGQELAAPERRDVRTHTRSLPWRLDVLAHRVESIYVGSL